ncbi:MAG: YedE-related selenium metabolism membrane protein [Clostridia bacterium]|nr:YedE-related selenium metabolism membrane protein [Clostridia bacterium]
MVKKKNWLAKNWLILLTGLIVGAAAVILSKLGNPGNMGFCIACFERDIAGALGLQRAANPAGEPILSYFRPEIVGIIFGSLIMAVGAKEFKGKGGSSPVIRFILGAVVMIGALVFLGCPLRMVIRIGGGDLNAVVGLAGFIVGILVGVVFLKCGFNLGRAHEQKKAEAGAFPAGLLLMFILCTVGVIGVVTTAGLEGAPGGARAPWYASIIAGLVVGAICQRSRFCMAGGIRDAVMFRDFGLIAGFGMVIVTVLVGNLILGNFKGFAMEGNPIAHTDGLWNFLGMVVVGWGSALLGGCPLRQLVLTGEGNSDSAITVCGMIVGAAFSHNFKMASNGMGTGENGHLGVYIGLGILVVVSLLFTFCKKKEN